MKNVEHSEEVLMGLQPHQSIEKIFKESYHGSRFPNWMSTSVFRQLKEISLVEFPRCEHLPPLGKLPSLTSLSLFRMDSIKCLDGEFHGGGETSFPALTSLKIRSMRNLERWSMVDSAESFPCLEDLSISHCPKLGGLPKLPTLKSLDIGDSSTAALNSKRFLTSLTSLTISRLEEVDVLPRGLLQNLKALKNLHIHVFSIRTVSTMLDNLSALTTFEISDCHNLEFLPEDFKYLSSLEKLVTWHCYYLKSFPVSLIEGLCSLRSLSINDCGKLKPLLGPLGQSPPDLHSLTLCSLSELEYLPENVQLLTSLKELNMESCEKLKSLPDGFKDLKSLRKLHTV